MNTNEMDLSELRAEELKDVPSVSELTFTERVALPQNIVDYIEVKVSQKQPIPDADALKRRIYAIVHWNTLNMSPVRTSYLNRLFGSDAKRLGLKVSEVVAAMLLRQQLTTFPFSGPKSTVSTAGWTQAQAYAAELIKRGNDLGPNPFQSWEGRIR